MSKKYFNNKEQIEEILLSETPDIRIRVINDDDPKPIKDNKIKYPFELFNTIKVTIKTTKREFSFDIPKGYTYNGADIPKVFWRIIGSKTDNTFLLSALLHDYLLDFKAFIINKCVKEPITIEEYRRLTSLIFREKLKLQGINTVKANIMSFAVDIFQIVNKKSWKV